MHSFTDAADQVWRVQLDIAAAIRVDDAQITNRNRTLVLTDPDKWVFPALMRSPRLQAQVLYEICRPQAEQLQVTFEQFLSLLSADIDDGAGGKTTILAGRAIPALALEISRFFQGCPISLNRLIRAQSSLTRLLETAAAGLKSDVATADATPITTSTDSPPSPDSTGGLPG